MLNKKTYSFVFFRGKSYSIIIKHNKNKNKEKASQHFESGLLVLLGVVDITNPGKRKGVADIVFYVNDILGNTVESHHILPEAVYLIPPGPSGRNHI